MTQVPPYPALADIDPASDTWLTESNGPSPGHRDVDNVRLRALCVLAQEAYRWRTHDEMILTVIGFLVRLLEPERCIIGVQSRSGTFDHVRAHGTGVEPDPAQWPVSQQLLARIKSEHLAVLSTDALEDQRMRHFDSVNTRNIRSLLCVPLGSKHDPRGLVYLDSRLRAGAFDRNDLHFLTAVCRLLDVAIEALDQRAQLEAQLQRDQQRIVALQSELFSRHRIVGQSPALLKAYAILKRIATGTDLPILLLGETGTGKELFARAAHWTSKRRAGPFVPTSLAAVTDTLVGSELFGHERGAFSGANQRRIGLLERADGGTLFLDEIADLPGSVQVALLRALQEKEFSRLGGNELVRSDFRLVCATSRPLAQMVDAGGFREDLYARLAGVTIRLPPLRERPEDIPDLVDHFLAQLELSPRFSPAAMSYLQQQPWPRNIRQLQCLVQGVAALAEEHTTIELRDIQSLHAPSVITPPGGDARSLGPMAELLATVERAHMERALRACGGNATEAARMIDVSKSTFSERRRKYGL